MDDILAQSKKIEIIGYTLVGIGLLREYFKKFENLEGTYAQRQYEGLKDAEYLAKQFLVEQLKDE